MRNRLIICGWYRNENAHWVLQLTRQLEAYRHQHDFVRIEEPTTKSEQALAAMDRHPGHVIAMVDAELTATCSATSNSAGLGKACVDLIGGNGCLGGGDMRQPAVNIRLCKKVRVIAIKKEAVSRG